VVAVLGAVGGVLALWAFVAWRTERARAATIGDRLPVLLLTLLGAAVFGLVAGDVATRDHAEAIRRLDFAAREVALAVRGHAPTHAAAGIMSWLTGEGLVIGLVAGIAALALTGRRREALVLGVGTGGAWVLSRILKFTFQIPRPRADPTAVGGDSFPSGHALVTIVACGLAAWLVGRAATGRVRMALYGFAAVVSLLTAASRMVLKAHWLSDVVGGLAIGLVWLNFAILVASRRGAVLARAPAARPAATGPPRAVEGAHPPP
jgi:membrane-associated phospholipid phosphatase